MAVAERLSIASPRTLREALGVSYRYREAVRWLIGTSPLLSVAYTHVPRDARIVDARGIAEFTAPASGGAWRIRFGAFAGEDVLRAHPLLAGRIFAAASPPVALAIADARVEIVSLGATRITPVDSLLLAAHEAPVAIELNAESSDLYVERRRAIRDGRASHDLILAASLRVGEDGTLERIRIAFSLDGERPVRVRLAEHHLERRRLSSDLAALAAKDCAEAIVPDGPRTAAAARSALPLALALFREARLRCDERIRSVSPLPRRAPRKRIR